MKMRNVCSLTLVVCCYASAQNGPPKVPDSILYPAFFAKVASWQRLVERAKAKGLTGKPAREAIKNEANLTDAEDESLQAIVKDFQTAMDPVLRQGSQIATQIMAQYPPPTPPPPAVQQQVAALRSQTEQIISSHIEQLKSALGQGRFQALDAYVRKTILPTITVTSVKAPPK